MQHASTIPLRTFLLTVTLALIASQYWACAIAVMFFGERLPQITTKIHVAKLRDTQLRCMGKGSLMQDPYPGMHKEMSRCGHKPE